MCYSTDIVITKPHFDRLITEIETAGLLAHAYFVADHTANEQKSDGSVVTAIDLEIEQKLVSYIRTHFSDDTIVGEEGDGHRGVSDFVWHIDPIDGTDNFLRKIPFCAISVARLGPTMEDSCAVIHNPITKQTFSAFMDEGVIEQSRIHRIDTHVLGGRAMISVARGREPWMKTASYNIRKALGLQFGGGNSYGSCALELAYVAANRLDGVLTFGLNSYDYGAGLFLIKTGGGMISVWRNTKWEALTGSLKDVCAVHGATIFASHAGVHAEALALIGDLRQWADA